MHGLEARSNQLLLYPANNQPQSISAAQIYGLDLHCKLVVLSGCETGRGPIRGADGPQSLGLAFLSAGSESVVTTLWKVQDKRTPALLELFYNNLRSGKQKQQALHEAKKRFIASEPNTWAHPRYWAGFTFTGNTAPIHRQRAHTVY